jgi:hypothetical protein
MLESLAICGVPLGRSLALPVFLANSMDWKARRPLPRKAGGEGAIIPYPCAIRPRAEGEQVEVIRGVRDGTRFWLPNASPLRQAEWRQQTKYAWTPARVTRRVPRSVPILPLGSCQAAQEMSGQTFLV